MPDAVAAALDATRAARQRFAATLPPANLVPGLHGDNLAERYRAEVLPRLHRASDLLPSPWEQASRLSAAEALSVAEAEILPVAAELLRKDIARIACFLGRDARLEEEARQAVAGREEVDPGRLIALAFEHDLPGHAPTRLLPLAEELLDAWLARRSWVMLGCPTVTCETPERPLLPPSDPPPRPYSQSLLEYERVRERLQPQIDRLVRDLEEVLRPRRRLRQRAGYATGQQVDLRCARWRGRRTRAAMTSCGAGPVFRSAAIPPSRCS